MFRLLVLPHDRPPVLDHADESRAQFAALLRFAIIEGDALGILAQAHEGEAEVGFHPLLG